MKQPPTHSDLDSIEHAMLQVSTGLKRMLELYPKLYKVKDKHIAGDDLLKRKLHSKRIQLAAKLQDGYKRKLLPIVDQLMGASEVEEVQNVQTLDLGEEVALNKRTESSTREEDGEGDEEEEQATTWPPALPPINDPKLYQQALTHKSVVGTNKLLTRRELQEKHNERLEFLGDSVLNFVMSDLVYRRMAGASEGVLSELRSRLVRNDTLWKWAVMYKLDEKLVIQEDQKKVVQDRDKRAKVTADVFEAYIGGVCLDSGFGTAQKWLLKLGEPLMEELEKEQKSVQKDTDFKAEVYTRIGSAQQRPQYICTQRDDSTQQFTVELRINDDLLGTGVGSSIKSAGQSAAYNALQDKDKMEHYAEIRRSTPRVVPKRKRDDADD